jgi:hypothetical protein
MSSLFRRRKTDGEPLDDFYSETARGLAEMTAAEQQTYLNTHGERERDAIKAAYFSLFGEKIY